MAGLSVLRGYAEEFEKQLRLKTFPIAVKLLEKVADLIMGLRYLEEHNNVLPGVLTVELEYKLPEKYEKLGKMLGMGI